MTADAEAANVLRRELARDKGSRAGAALKAAFADLGFTVTRTAGREVARQIRALTETGDLAADLTTVATGVLDHFAWPHDPAEVRAAITRHLARP